MKVEVVKYSLNDYGGQSEMKMLFPNHILTDTLCIRDSVVISIIATREGNTQRWMNRHPLKYSLGHQGYSDISDCGDGQVTARGSLPQRCLIPE